MFDDHYGLEQAVLAGTKTMTRRALPKRVLKMLELSMMPALIIPVSAFPDGLSIEEFVEQFANQPQKPIIVRNDAEIIQPKLDDILKEVLKYSTYQVGEVVAIAQRYTDIVWRTNPNCEIPDLSAEGELYMSKGWRNKMYVKAELMPYRIRITNVRIERLQDISDEDCLREGLDERIVPDGFGGIIKDYSYKNSKGIYCCPREGFYSLINAISGKETWDKNPWVFVYEFELVNEVKSIWNS